MKKQVLLSFDVEEFDLPREHGGEISVAEGVKVSSEGFCKVLDLLKKRGVKATFFVTGNFAEGAPELVSRMVKEGHEVACHGVDHFNPKKTDVEKSKEIVEKIAGVPVVGWRQPRMFRISYSELKRCGYAYDSSVNPAFIPGRYNNTKVPRKPYVKGGVLEIPTSVTGLRVPMFWLALHLFPLKMYCGLARKVLRDTGYFATYFHPWEFASLSGFKEVPWYIKRNSGMELVQRLDKVICELEKEEGEFVGYAEFAECVMRMKCTKCKKSELCKK